jgi:hydrogenase-4 component B
LALAFRSPSICAQKPAADHVGTWDCGYVAPGPTMQYSSSSFAQTLVGLFSWALRPKVTNPDTRGLFPHPEAFTSNVADVVLDSILIPAAATGQRACVRWFRWVQRGSMQAYSALHPPHT